MNHGESGVHRAGCIKQSVQIIKPSFVSIFVVSTFAWTMSLDRISNHEKRAKPRILVSPKEESNVRRWTDGKSEKSPNSSLEQKSRSPLGIRPLYDAADEKFEAQNRRYPSPASRSASRSPLGPKISRYPSPASRSASRSPLGPKITSQSSHHYGPIATTPSPTSDLGKRRPRNFAAQADSPSRCSSVHASPELCDPDIVSIIYPTPSTGKPRILRKTTIPKLSFFQCFGRRKRKSECCMENKSRSFRSSEAKEQERLKKEDAWKKVKEGRNGKSTIERQFEWHNGLREYEDDSSWQRRVGPDIRKRHQDIIIKTAVREKPISKLQEVRSDAIIMEKEVFGSSKDLDEYKTKTRQIVKALDAKRQSQRQQKILETENRKKNTWVKLVELLPKKASSLTHLWGGKDLPTSSSVSVEATPCNCREKELLSISPFQDKRTKSGGENSSFQNEVTMDRQNEVTLNKLRKMTYKPNLKRIEPSYRDGRSAVGWIHKWPREHPQDSWYDESQETSSPHPQRDDLCLNIAKKIRKRSTKAQIKADDELDDDEWSIIDRESSLQLSNLFKCFR